MKTYKQFLLASVAIVQLSCFCNAQDVIDDGYALPPKRKINLITIGYDIDNNAAAKKTLQDMADAVKADGAEGKMILSSADESALDDAMQDAFGLATSSSSNISNQQPNLTIEAPADGASVAAESPVVLQAIAYDPEEGQLPPGGITWASDVQGALGSGGQLTVPGLRAGTHTITAQIADSKKSIGQAAIRITAMVSMPVITISPGQPFDVSTPGREIVIGKTADPVHANIRLRLSPTGVLAMWFEGNWIPVGGTTAYGKDFKLTKVQSDGQDTIWTFSNSMHPGDEYGVFAPTAQTHRIICK